jgi:TRAP-type mannitol/chloroaromatic compound transport system permease large subunit
MSPETAGIAGIALLLLLFLLKMPVAFAMMLVGLVGFAYLGGIESALTLLAQDIFEVFTSYPLSVIPMFILMGSFAFASGISHRLNSSHGSHHGQNRTSGDEEVRLR